MYRIGNMTFEGALRFEPDRIYAVLPNNLTNEQIGQLKDADVVEIVEGENVKASYNLVNWASIENTGSEMMMSWFRFDSQRIDELENAIAELAAMLAAAKK